MSTDVPGIDNRWALFDTSPALVETRFKEAQAYATEAFKTCMEALAALQRIGLQLDLINKVIRVTQLETYSIELPERNEPYVDLSDFHMDIGSPPQDTTSLINVTLDTFPEFDNPVVTPITPPSESYVSALLTAIKAKLLDDLISGDVGMPASVEAAIFARESERALLVHQENLDRISTQWAAGGWPVPNGALMAAIDKAEADFTNKRLDVSRDISIKNYELTLQNMHFIIQNGINLEKNLMDWTHNVAVLALDASKAVLLGDIESFKALTDGKKAQLQGIVEKAQAEIAYNKGQIDIYTARMNGYGIRARAEGDRVTALGKGYESQASVFNSLVNYDISKVGLDLKVLDLKLKEAELQANVDIKDKDIMARNQEVIHNISVEAMKAAGSIAAQLVAGAMSAVHASVGISASDSGNYSFSTSLTDAANASSYDVTTA